MPLLPSDSCSNLAALLGAGRILAQEPADANSSGFWDATTKSRFTDTALRLSRSRTFQLRVILLMRDVGSEAGDAEGCTGSVATCASGSCLFRGHACLLDTHRRLSAICGICKVVRANLVSKITSSLTQQDINVPAPLPWRFSSGLTVIR